MQLETIKLYCDIAEHRSVSVGAHVNGITQSAASQRIAALEKELGIQLIDRSKRPLQLTEAGTVYHEGSQRILEQYEKLRRRMQSCGGDETDLCGEVVIAAIYSSGIDLMNQVRIDFEGAYPQTKVTIHYLQPDVVYEKVRADQCDFGILSYPRRWRGVGAIPLRDEVMVVVTRPGHVLADRETIHPEDLAEHGLVMFDFNLPISNQLNGYFDHHGVQPRIVHCFDNIDTIKNCVADTDFAAILPNRTVQREVRQGTLAAVRLEPTLVRPIGIVHRKGREMSALCQTFIDYLLTHQPAASRPDVQATATA